MINFRSMFSAEEENSRISTPFCKEQASVVRARQDRAPAQPSADIFKLNKTSMGAVCRRRFSG